MTLAKSKKRLFEKSMLVQRNEVKMNPTRGTNNSQINNPVDLILFEKFNKNMLY